MLLPKKRFPAMSLPVCAHLLRAVSGLQVPWEQVPDLVAGRRVLLRQGSAYVHKREMGSLVVSHFRKQLGLALALTARKWASQLAAEEADRLTPIVEALSMRCKRPAYVMRRMTGSGFLSLASHQPSCSIMKDPMPRATTQLACCPGIWALISAARRMDQRIQLPTASCLPWPSRASPCACWYALMHA